MPTRKRTTIAASEAERQLRKAWLQNEATEAIRRRAKDTTAEVEARAALAWLREHR